MLSAAKRLGYLYGTPPLDNFIFKLCYRWTTILLIVFSFVITCKLWKGYSFSCISSSVNDLYSTVECYDKSIYTVPSTFVAGEYGLKLVRRVEEEDKRFVDYYSWVNLLFLVHAFNFYLPHLLWKSYERGYMYKLTAGIQKYLDKEEKRNLKLCHLAKYVFATQNKHKLYTLLYIAFEILNFIISLTHYFWLIHFFNVTGVPKYLSYVIKTWLDYKYFYFPTRGYCNFERYGSSGTVQRHEALCQLPLNSLYMKMFLFLHAWYFIMAVLTGLMLAYRIILLNSSVRAFITRISSSLSSTSILKSVCHQLSYSDWFFLSRLQNSMTDFDFSQMLEKILIVSQGKDPQCEEYKLFSVLDNRKKDVNNTNLTSPL